MDQTIRYKNMPKEAALLHNLQAILIASSYHVMSYFSLSKIPPRDAIWKLRFSFTLVSGKRGL